MECNYNRHQLAVTLMKKRIVTCCIIALCLIFAVVGFVCLPRKNTAPPVASGQTTYKSTEQSDAKRSKTPDTSENRRLVDYLHNMLMGEPQQTWETKKSLQQAGEELLDLYKEKEHSVPVFSGYLDVLGKTWGCIFQGNGWTDICLVTDTDAVRKVAICHMTTQEMQDVIAQG